MDNRPIGVFDSGLGGLTAVRHLRELLPNENIVYFGDTGRVPYGTRSRDTIRRYTIEDCQLLLSNDVKYIIAACGTVSSVAPDILASLPVPAIGVVTPTAKAAAAATRNKKVGILGTSATIRSAAFANALRELDPSIEVTATPCPLFVSLVESGWIQPDDSVAVPMVKRYLTDVKAAGVDTLILGCTHFPLLAPIIQAELGDNVVLIDSGWESAALCAEQLQSADQLSQRDGGSVKYYVSDQPEGFSQVAEIFLGQDVEESVQMIHPGQTDQKRNRMNAIIRIKGIQSADGEEDVIELTTTGTLERSENGWILCYQETEATGMEGTVTKLDMTPGKLTLMRSGTHPSMLILEKNQRHHCNYHTPYGTIDLGTYASVLDYRLDDHGGSVHFSYTLGFHGGVSSAHSIHITVQEEN